MADLHNLFEELEADPPNFYHEEDEEDDDKPTAAGRPSVETAVTEPLSLDHSHENDDDENDHGDDWDSPGGSSSRRFISIPAALQDAKRHKDTFEYDATGETMGIDMKDGDDDEEGGRMNEWYTKLHQFWHHEQHCPEILEYDTAIVQEIKAQMDERQEWIHQVTADATANANLEAGDLAVQTVLVHIAQVDLDRIKYVLACWMAERLAKIEAHPLHMRDKVDHLSDAEVEYLKEYGSLLHEHLHQTVLDHIPQAWQRLDEPNMIDQPDYEGYHFWLVQEPIGVDDVEQDEGSTLVAKYTAMRDFMRDNKVELLL